MVLTEHSDPRRQNPDATSRSWVPTVSAPPTNRSNLAIPRRGHVLTSVSEEYGRPVRTAVAVLTEALQDENRLEVHQSCISRRIPEPGAWVVRPPAEMLAWTLVSAWLTGFATGRLSNGAGLGEAASWFFSALPHTNPVLLVPTAALTQADNALSACRDSVDYLELLPYVLDPHGPGSRLSVRRDAATWRARNRKRAEGIYYTPVDVADFMLRECIEGLASKSDVPAVLDPACGTGVFLRAAVETLKDAFPDQTTRSICETAIYGSDVDPWALDASAFVLLSSCLLDSGEKDVSPLLLWHRLRLNLACVDALTLDPPCPESRENAGSATDVVASIASGQLPAPATSHRFEERVPLSRAFPMLPDTGLVVVGNPPYSALGHRSDLPILNVIFASLARKISPAAESYPLFLEQMVRLAPADPAAGALVLPLSLASNVGNQFAETRSLIEKTPGRWRFAFFDREPHALFGEDVKTRNTILFWHRDKENQETEIETGPLRKWRGHSRAAMFDSIRFTPIVGAIRSGIPKIDGSSQARAFEELTRRWDRLEHVCTEIRRMPLAQVLTNDGHTVFSGATAYNFLNIFLRPPEDVLESAPALSEHPLHALHLPTREDAAAAFALLSSHIAFWWWHANHDGFHVTRRFLAGLPFGMDAMSGAPREMLADCGERLWSLIRIHPILSVNRGRMSLAYSPNGFDCVRSEIDQILAGLAGLEPAFVDELQQFTAHTIRAEVRATCGT